MARYSPTDEQLKEELIHFMEELLEESSIYRDGCTIADQKIRAIEIINQYPLHIPKMKLWNEFGIPRLWHYIKHKEIEVPVNVKTHRAIIIPIETIDKDGKTKYVLPPGGARTRDFITASVEELNLYWLYRKQQLSYYNEAAFALRELYGSAFRRSGGDTTMRIYEIIRKTGGL